jgi:hypothetical protein
MKRCFKVFCPTLSAASCHFLRFLFWGYLFFVSCKAFVMAYGSSVALSGSLEGWDFVT